ncbi:MAG: single-stranded DNA-binding protein, partial [Planctomycetes bacterium]|nr:single-stranded DNA-binding protein [Planctomycetota bacterium]
MASLNRVFLIGNLTRDPELRYLPSGSAVCEFGLAVNRTWFDQKSGEKKEDVAFIDIVVWAKQGEMCAEYLKKGRSTFIEGRLQFEQWQSQDGQKRSKLRVVGERVQCLDSKGSGGGGGAGGGGGGGRGGGPGAGGP